MSTITTKEKEAGDLRGSEGKDMGGVEGRRHGRVWREEREGDMM